MVKKIYLDQGHGRPVDVGAINEKEGLVEADLNLKISQYVEGHLNDTYTGFEIKNTRTDNKTFLSLAERANRANAFGADAFMSIHVNAGGGTGYESFIYEGTSSEKTIKLQKIVNEKAVAAAKTFGLGVHGYAEKRDNLAVLRRTNMSAVLTEIAFIDSKDAQLLKKEAFLKAMGVAYAEGIAEFLELSKKKEASKPATSSDKKQLVKVIYDGKEGLNIREKADFNSKVAAVAKKDEAFTILEELKEFYRIQSGYITKAKEYVTVVTK
jgi:N-acetylmuramoyl-L-alanine amidase